MKGSIYAHKEQKRGPYSLKSPPGIAKKAEKKKKNSELMVGKYAGQEKDISKQAIRARKIDLLKRLKQE